MFRPSCCLALLVTAMLAAPAAAQTLVVGNKVEHTVSFVDLASGKEVKRLPTGRAPHEIALSPDGRTAVVVSYREPGYDGRTLHLFDVEKGESLGEIDLGEHRGPHGLKWIPGSDLVAVTTEVTKDIALVDVSKRKLVATIPTDMGASHMVAVSPDGARAYVANIASGNMSVIDLQAREKIADVAIGAGAEGITVAPDGREIWVGANNDRKVVRIDAHSLEPVGEFAVEGIPIRVEHSPDGRHVAVSEADLDRVLVFDAASQEEVARIDLSSKGLKVPVTMLWRPDGKALYVATTQSKTVSEIDAADWSIARTFAVGEGSDGLGYSPVVVAAAD